MGVDGLLLLVPKTGLGDTNPVSFSLQLPLRGSRAFIESEMSIVSRVP